MMDAVGFDTMFQHGTEWIIFALEIHVFQVTDIAFDAISLYSDQDVYPIQLVCYISKYLAVSFL